MSTNTDRYRASRDQLLTASARADGRVPDWNWPDLEPTFNWAVDWFDAVATDCRTPALTIVEEDGATETVTYDEMRRRSNAIARWLSDRGVLRGDAVILMLGNQVELWESMLAVMKLGAVIMPTTTAVGPSELIDRLERGEAKHVICNAADVAKFVEVPGDYTRLAVGTVEGWHDLRDGRASDDSPLPHPGTVLEDPLLLYFTSGTTSRPKLVEHTQASYPVGHLVTTYWLGLQPGDVHLNISSPGWAKHAWSCFFAPWIAEATIFIYNYERFDPSALLDRLRTHEVSTFCAPPTVWRMLIGQNLGERPSALREVIGAGEPLNPEVISQVRGAWGLTLRDGFGQTEMTAAIGNVTGAPVKPGSMGQPLPGVPVVLVDPITGAPVSGAGAEGEICLQLEGPLGRPVPLMTGYRGNPDKTAEAMADGFYHTGDVASLDSDGYFTYIGRTDDVFKASDYKVSPFELESVLIEHPAVAEAAVVPTPDAVRLAVPKAYIALSSGWEPNEETAFQILKHARENLPPYLRVRRIEFADLPKTISGKIRRVELRVREQDLADTGSSAPEEWRDDQFPALQASPVSSA